MAANPCRRSAAADAGKDSASRSASWRAPNTLSTEASSVSSSANSASVPRGEVAQHDPILIGGLRDLMQRERRLCGRAMRVQGTRIQTDPARRDDGGQRGLQGFGGDFGCALQQLRIASSTAAAAVTEAPPRAARAEQARSRPSRYKIPAAPARIGLGQWGRRTRHKRRRPAPKEALGKL